MLVAEQLGTISDVFHHSFSLIHVNLVPRVMSDPLGRYWDALRDLAVLKFFKWCFVAAL